MFFKNLTLFRFPTSVDFSEVDTLLPHVALKPVGALEMSSRGFISPFGREEKEQFSHRIGDALWLTVGGEEKILPGAVVNDLLARRLEEIEEKEGRKPGGRERKRLKDDLLHELLPRAFVKSSRTDALLDLEHGFLAVDSSSRKSAEAVASEIRRALGSFPAIPPNAEVAPRSILTGWIAGEPMPDGLTLGEECELKDAMDGGAVVKAQHQELLSDEIDKHLEAGKQVTKLALNLDEISEKLKKEITDLAEKERERDSEGQKRARAVKRLEVVEAFPLPAEAWRREAFWSPDGAGLVRITVLDQTGQAASAAVWISRSGE